MAVTRPLRLQPSPAGPAGKMARRHLYLLARQRLAALGVAGVHGGDSCTFTEAAASSPIAATAGRAAWRRWSGSPERRRGLDWRYLPAHRKTP